MKIVINRCFGGFGLSAEAVALLVEDGGEETRADPALVSVVETFGKRESKRGVR